ncbi:MAG: glycosyltransferase family 9 protein [Bacteroidales bacterium]
MDTPINVLIIRFSAFGDVAMSTAAIKGVVEKYHNTKFTVLTKSACEPLFSGIKDLNVIGVDLKSKYKSVGGVLKLAKQLSKNNYDFIIDLHDVLRTKLIRSYFFTAKGVKSSVIDKGRNEKKDFIRQKLSSPLKHTADRYLDAFKKADIHAKFSIPSLIPGNEAVDVIEKYIKSLPQKRTVCIAPYAAHDNKVWGDDKVVELIELLQTEQLNILLIGGKPEKDKLDNIAGAFDNVEVVAGKFSLEEEMSLLATVDLNITMDSFNMHLASLSGGTVASIWGATDPSLGFAPLGKSKEFTISAERELPCRPCSVYGAKKCEQKSLLCMEKISAKSVYGFIKNKKLI